MSNFLKKIRSFFIKFLTGIMLGLGSSIGKNPIEIEHKTDQEISEKK
ncbi:hypothetical protein HOF40_00895 [Candidatus Parcubacteria bacterium]|jgi:hypothetical protein|nr:hypothetical protein [Candidatus Parcubacteria bacterium]MBT3948628.1 hypothetical protein [Candidatus Parcubacteria bacterium]